MQVRNSYDLVVMGDQLSGLFLAAGAAQRGLRVLVLEQRSVPSVSFEAPSGRFLGDFLAEPFLGLESGGKMDSFLRSLGLYQQLGDLFPLHQPALQIAGHQMRLNFPYQEKELLHSLKREFPQGPQHEAWVRLLSGQTQTKGSFADALAKEGLPVEGEAYGWLQSCLYGSLANAHFPYVAYKEILALAAKSVRYPLGGRSGLKERLQARIQVYGGAIKRATRVEEIVFEKGQLAGVLLSSFEGFVRSSFVAGAMGAGTFLSLVPEKYRPGKLKDAVKTVAPRFWRLSFTLLVPEASLPEGLGSHLALMGEGDGEFLQAQVFPKEAYGGVPAGHKVLVVRALVPFEPENLGPKAVSRHIKRALRRLESVLPFLNERPFVISPDPEKLESDPAYQRYYRFKDLDYIPPSYLAYASELEEGSSSARYMDWARFGLRGLALCSRDIYPLFGPTGEIMVAMDLLDSVPLLKNSKLKESR